MKIFLFLLPVLILASCASAPPTADQIQQKVAVLLPEPSDPGQPFPRVILEPTGVRWTLFRSQEESTQNYSHGMIPTADSILGIEFGHGLFLDSQGNLSIVPYRLWPDYWTVGVRYEGKILQDVWQGDFAEIIGFETSSTGIKAYRPGSFGTKVEEYDLASGQEVKAFDRTATRKKDGTWQEVNQKKLLAPAEIYKNNDSGAEHTVKSYIETTFDYTAADQGVTSSNRSFSIKTVQDHWEITVNLRTLTKRWLAYFGVTKMVLVDSQTGQIVTAQQIPNGAELEFAKGHKESLEAKQTN